MNTRKIIVQQHSKWQKNKCHKNECHILRGNEEQLVENIHTLIWNIIHVWKITEGKYQKITQTECRAQSQTCGIELIFSGILSWKLHFAFIFGRNCRTPNFCYSNFKFVVGIIIVSSLLLLSTTPNVQFLHWPTEKNQLLGPHKRYWAEILGISLNSLNLIFEPVLVNPIGSSN